MDDVGNGYTTGEFKGTADFDPGPGVFELVDAGSGDVLVSKLDGQPAGTRAAAAPISSFQSSMAVSSTSRWLVR